MPDDVVVTGIGVVSAIGNGKPAFAKALLDGDSAFRVMRREGRQKNSAFIGAEIDELTVPVTIPKRTLRSASLSAQAALTVLQEAWDEARLSDLNPDRVGLVVAGSNFQQRELTNIHDAYRDKTAFLRPTYGLGFMDSDLCGFCTEQFGIRGAAFTVGGASASGQLAIVQAAQAVRAMELDACIAIGALMDLSYWECQALRSIGAMGSDRFATEPDLACRPFDNARDGFIFGECSGAMVIETAESGARRGLRPYATLKGWGIAMDGNRNPDPSLEGESRAIRQALERAKLEATAIDYVNPHGTGSIVGDQIELQALRACGVTHCHLNTTKSLIGHGLSAAGVVEAIATLLQMREGRLHKSKNLHESIDEGFMWVRESSREHTIANALTLSMGFGGINTALCWQRSR